MLHFPENFKIFFAVSFFFESNFLIDLMLSLPPFAISRGFGTKNYGVFGWAIRGTENYGVYGWATVATCTNGAASGCTDAAGFFEGDVFCTTNRDCSQIPSGSMSL